MSRTDKTRPFRVKVYEQGREHHDHSNGVCDLATDPHRLAGGVHTCGLTYDGWRREVGGCPHSCWMCAAVEKQQKASLKARAKAVLRTWWREYEDDVQDEPLIYDALNEDNPEDYP